MNQKKTMKIYVRNKNTKAPRKLPKILIALFTLAQCLGLHFGFVDATSKKTKAVYFMTTIMACLIVMLMSYGLKFDIRHGNLILFIQYILNFFILITSRCNLREFLTELITDERPLDFKGDKTELIIWLYIAAVFAIKVFSSTIYYVAVSSYLVKDFMPELVLQIVNLSQDMIPLANAVLFIYVYMRMRDLKLQLERREINAECLYTTYKTIAGSLDKFRKSYDAVFVLRFAADLSKLMILIWEELIFMKSAPFWVVIGCSLSRGIHITRQIFLPAVFAEMINVETDAMKMILHQRCLDETDEAAATEWDQVLGYMKARPLLRKAWRLMPVDMQHPITMCSMCFTYLIVTVQLTHIYD